MQAAIFASLIAAGTVGAVQRRNAGLEANYTHEQAARQEETSARDREIDRRRRLIRALASQSNEAGAMGITTGVGSRKAIALSDASRASYEGLADRASSGRRALMLRRAGKAAETEGKLGAATTLLGTAADAMQAWPGR